MINKTGKSKGFALIVTPEKVHQDLLKLDGIDLLGRKILIKEAISTRKKDTKQNKRPIFVVSNFPENRDLFKWPRIIPDNKLYVTVVSEREVDSTYEERNYSRQPQRKKNFIIGDSHLTRIKKDKFYFNCFSRTNTKQLDHYVIPVLFDEKPQTVVIHIGSNDISKFNYHNIDVNDVANRILQIGLKSRSYGVLLFRLFLLEMIITLRRTLRSEKFFGNWKSFKNDEKCFLFHLKSSFCSQDI